MTTGSYVIGNSNTPLYAKKVWSGVDDPVKPRHIIGEKWSKLSRRVRPENPYNMTAIRIESGKTQIYVNGVWNRQFQCKAVLGNQAPAATLNDELSLLSRLAEKIRGHDFNPGVFVAETRQSLEMIGSTAKAVLAFVSSCSRLDVTGAVRALSRFPGTTTSMRDAVKRNIALRDVGGAVLAARYGWQPLVYDCYEAAKALEELSKYRGLVFRANYTRKGVMEQSTSALWSCKGKWFRTCKYKIILSEPLSVVRSLSLANPAIVVWEEVPWSFVVDWFIPVGDYLANLGFFYKLDLKYVKTDFSRVVCNSDNDMPYPNLNRGETYVGGFVRSNTVSLRRTVGNSLNVPRPSFKTIAEAFSLTHVQNAAALISTGMRIVRR